MRRHPNAPLQEGSVAMSPDTPNDDSRTTGLSRRRFLTRVALGAVGFAGSMSWMPRTAWSDASAASPEADTLPIALLEKSPLVYISPLRRNGEESSCHSELWYAWLDGSVVVTVASTGWKARALAAGLDRARIWVGNHGRWKSWVGSEQRGVPKCTAFRRPSGEGLGHEDARCPARGLRPEIPGRDRELARQDAPVATPTGPAS